MVKTVEQTYKVLDEIAHIRQRTGMYAGSVVEQTNFEWVYDSSAKKMVKQDVTYTPALIKIFSEILDNATDEAKRAPETLDSIRVSFNPNGEIVVQDNGRGIPVKIHPDTGQYIAETVFTNLRAGSNFNDEDDQALSGTNGVGSTICVILSKSFTVESSDGTNSFKQTYENGLRNKGDVHVKPSSKNGTKITFTPDYEFFKLPGLSEGNLKKMVKRVFDVASTLPNVKFYVNGERLAIKDFGDYVALYATDYVTDITDDWKVGISSSEGFEHISFINSLEVYQGGTHVDYVMNQIVSRVREFIEKKHKIDVKPSDIRSHMRVYISANINRPKFTGQSKELMVSQVSEYKTSWSVPDKMIKKIINSSIIQSILEWAAAKAQAAEMKALRDLNKDAAKTKPNRVPKFYDAVEKDARSACAVYLSEGDSAANSIQSARGKNRFIGSFALKGKPLNVYDVTTADVLENKEFASILAITGLQFGEKVESLPDAEWVYVSVNGVEQLVNVNDTIRDGNTFVKVSDLI